MAHVDGIAREFGKEMEESNNQEPLNCLNTTDETQSSDMGMAQLIVPNIKIRPDAEVESGAISNFESSEGGENSTKVFHIDDGADEVLTKKIKLDTDEEEATDECNVFPISSCASISEAQVPTSTTMVKPNNLENVGVIEYDSDASTIYDDDDPPASPKKEQVSLLDVLRIIKTSGMAERDWKKLFKETVTGSIVQATHSNFKYTIVDVKWDYTPWSVFKCNGKMVKFADVYTSKNVKIQNLNQPLLLSTLNDSVFKKRYVYLLPEFCRFTGLRVESLLYQSD